MSELEITEKSLAEIEQSILNISEEEFYNIYKNNEFIFEIMERTKNKSVFLKCLDYIDVRFLVKKATELETSNEMIFKLTLSSRSLVQHAILERDDVTPELLKQMIENFKDEGIDPIRYEIINHKKMNEETLYSLTDYDNNQILSLILLTDIVSQRIIKKLQKSTDPEIKAMARVRDPQTDPNYIAKIIRREIKNNTRTKDDPINPYSYNTNSLVITDVLEAALKNPNLSADTLNLFKGFTKTVVLTLIIPHPNISQELLDYYYKKGGDDVKKAILARKEDVVR